MRVKLLTYTPDPERLCAAAAKTSYRSGGATGILQKLSIEDARKTLRRVLGYGHRSVIEHASFTFSAEEVSRALTHQLVRHRIASYTQQSQRYVTYDAPEHYVIPRNITQNQEAQEIYNHTLEHISDAYQELLNLEVPKEDARFLLPNAAKTNIVITMNARELRHFFNLRCCERAQWEIRKMAIEMLKQVKEVAPALFEDAGPFCVEFGYCPEGKLKPEVCSIEEIKKRFGEL